MQLVVVALACSNVGFHESRMMMMLEQYRKTMLIVLSNQVENTWCGVLIAGWFSSKSIVNDDE